MTTTTAPAARISERQLLEAVEAGQVTWHPHPTRPKDSFAQWYNPTGPSPRYRKVTSRAQHATADGLIRIGRSAGRVYLLTTAGADALAKYRADDVQDGGS